MNVLSDLQILEIWEKGLLQSSLQRALLFLTTAMPKVSLDDLLKLSIGQKNHYLLTIYEKTFGSLVNCFVKCTICNESLEFPLDLKTFYTDQVARLSKQTFILNDYMFHFRLITVSDLLTVVQTSTENISLLLLERCLLNVSYNNRSIAIPELPGSVLNQFIEHLQKTDPQAEILLNLICPTCKHAWKEAFDIKAFLWEKTKIKAKRLLENVHQLAKAYGWQESTILEMSTARRQYYLERIGANG